ncbi:hypothetical protein BC829DRAFT_216011 [Chytridium lagenaria]|nr:hypothetical protein BC829DRAFT_216011 [Chytridium lagenaria]
MVPLGLEDEREMTIEGCINVLTNLANKFNLVDASKQRLLFLGDCGTLMTARRAMRQRSYDYGSPYDRLRFVRLVPGEFHYRMQVVDILCNMFWGEGCESFVAGSLRNYARKFKKLKTLPEKEFHLKENLLLEAWDCFVIAFYRKLCADYHTGTTVNELQTITPETVRVISQRIMRAVVDSHQTIRMETQRIKDEIAFIKKNALSKAAATVTLEARKAELTPKTDLKTYMLQFIWHILHYKRFLSSIRHGDGDSVICMHRLFLSYFKFAGSIIILMKRCENLWSSRRYMMSSLRLFPHKIVLSIQRVQKIHFTKAILEWNIKYVLSKPILTATGSTGIPSTHTNFTNMFYRNRH